ncbi:hypothetical protein [Hyphomonas johnsonii]|uniref:hypothetical protein n=1 Tax=Hyphomonas johnsonii TaxID=81031 RepID=UPI0012EB9DA9|nr:hypothetical protein [Hyphomonas johnsonii]
MARNASIIEQGLLAALALAAEKPWADLTLGEIAAQAGLTLADFHGVATRETLADAVDAYFDSAMSAEGVATDDLPRERLFEVIMLRFEAMEAHRDGLKSLLRYRETVPAHLIRLPAARRASARWALACAGLDDNSGAPLGLKVLAIAFVIARAERAWRRETSGDFALTMAALDRSLRAAEERMGWVARFTGRGASRSETDTPASDDAAPGSGA